MRRRIPLLVSAYFLITVSCHCTTVVAQSADRVLRGLLEQNGVESLDRGGGHSEERIELGQALFFDRELSGNRDTSCATCHHPTLASGGWTGFAGRNGSR